MVQFFKMPSGEEVAILPRAEYEALVAEASDADEDAADLAMFDARMAEASPGLSPEVSMAVLRGDSLLKAVREWRGFTQLQVAQRETIGISQGHLSDIESGRRNATERTLQELARIYGVDASLFAKPAKEGGELANRAV